jgi:APA family basic amino acid/polyamine antiporter
MQTDTKHLVRGLGLTAAIAVNVANIIGTGVFLKARVMTCNVGTPGKALAVWVFAGLLSLAGGLTYAELLASTALFATHMAASTDSCTAGLSF